MDSELFDHSWLATALQREEDQHLSTHSSQDEIVEPGKVFKNPVHLFGQFVLAVPSDDLKNIEQLAFSTFVRDFCKRTPAVAQYVVQEIRKQLEDNSQPEAQVSQKRGSSTNSKQSSRRKQTDRTYQPPKPPTKQPKTGGDEPESVNTAVKCHSLVSDDSVTYQTGQETKCTNQGSDNLTTEESQPIQKTQTLQGVQSIQETQPSQKAQSLHESEDNVPESVVEKEKVLPEGEQDQPTIDDSITYQAHLDSISINQITDSLETENTQSLRKYEEDIPETIMVEKVSQEAVQDQPTTTGYTTCTEVAEHLLKPTYSSDDAIGDAAYEESSVIIDGLTENSQTTCLPSLPNEAGHKRSASPGIDGIASDAQEPLAASSPHSIEPHETTLCAPTPSTPVRQSGQQLPSPFSGNQTITSNTTIFTPTVSGSMLSPLTEIDRTASPPEKADMTQLEGITSPSSCTGQQQIKLSNTAPTQAQQADVKQLLRIQDCQTVLPSSPQVPTLIDMVAKTIQTMHAMSSGQETPSEIHCEILSTIRSSPDVILVAPTTVEGEKSTRITSCSKLLSASMWLNMLEVSQARSRTATILHMIEMMGASEWYEDELAKAEREPPRTKRGVPRKRLATIVLDEYLKEPQDSTPIGSPEKLTSKDSEDRSSSRNSADIQKSILAARRKKLTQIFHKGRAIRKLVRMTHLGILFVQNIWSYVKLSNEDIDKLAISFQGDPQKMKLLSILDKQVVLLVETGQLDLSNFFDSLESHAITTSEEVSSLRAKYGREREPVPQGYLDAAINGIVERIGNVLSKKTLSDDDAMMVNGAVELPCGMFDRLRSKEWLYCWDIRAALEMTDRPISVKFGHSIQLHKKDAGGKITPLQNPFRRWRSEIDTYRHENESGLEGPLVYFCPLNLNTNHFTLLEINEQTKMIYHYDSMASHATIHRKTKSTPTRRQIQEEFEYLNFGYVEAPCPQQKDVWSCGLMVIRNAKRRMTGLPVGCWRDEVDPDRVIIEVLGDCQTFLENDVLQPISLFKKRKRVGEGLQNDAPEVTRVSKRLKQISVDS